MKYLKLEFRNAGFFETDKYTKDFVYDLNGRRKRTPSGQKVSISVNQVSNMLHVLLGERPSATYRDTLIDPIQSIRDIADKSMIKITTPRYFNDKKGVYYYGKEMIKTNKSVWNSWRIKPGTAYWKRIERLLTDDGDNSLYIELINILEKNLNKKVTNDKAINIINEFNNMFPNHREFNDFKHKLVKLLKKPIADFLETGTYNTEMSSNARTRLMNNNGIDKITRINGFILIPLENDSIEKLKNSKGCATLLDGGVVFIDDLIESEYMSDSILNEYININKLEEYESQN